MTLKENNSPYFKLYFHLCNAKMMNIKHVQHSIFNLVDFKGF